jgi:hypothetical protein
VYKAHNNNNNNNNNNIFDIDVFGNGVLNYLIGPIKLIRSAKKTRRGSGGLTRGPMTVQRHGGRGGGDDKG